MTDKRDVELIIKATDLSSKTFKDVAAAISSITKSLDQQIAGAAKGQVTFKELEQTLQQLKTAGDALIKQQGLIDYYKNLGVQLEAAKVKAESAREAQANLAKQLSAGGDVTAKQARELANLDKAAGAAENKVVSLAARLGEQGAKLAQAGIDTNALDAAQTQLVHTATQLGGALGVVGESLQNYQNNIRATKAAEAELATAEAQRVAGQRARTVAADLQFQEALTAALHQQTVANEALAAAEARRAGTDRASQVNRDLQFQDQLNAALLVEAERKDQLSKLDAFQKVGTDAEAAAAKLGNYAVAANAAAPATSRIASALNSILNPSQEAVRSLGGIETQVAALTAQVGEAKGPIRDYQDAIIGLEQAQRAIVSTAGKLDAFNNQATVLKEAEAEFAAAKAQVLEYAQAIRSASAPNEELAASLASAEARLASADKEVQQQRTRWAEYATTLKGVGIEVNQVVQAEQRLAVVANETAGAVNKLNAAQRGTNSGTGRLLGLRPYELQNLSFQINDVFTQLASGTSILQTLAQQGGQFFQLFQGQIANLAPKLGSIIPLVGLAVGGFVILAATLKNIYDLESSERRFTAQLAINADAAVYNAKALAETAHALDVYGGSIKDTRAALAEFIKANLDPTQFERFGVAAQDLADVTGKKLPEAAKRMAEGFTGGIEQIDKLQEEFHFLTLAQYEQIEAEFKNGDATKANSDAFDILAGKMHTAAEESRTNWTVAIRNLTGAWDGFLHALQNSKLIQGVANDIDRLATVVKHLTDLLPEAGNKADAAAKQAAGPGGKPAEKPSFVRGVINAVPNGDTFLDTFDSGKEALKSLRDAKSVINDLTEAWGEMTGQTKKAGDAATAAGVKQAAAAKSTKALTNEATNAQQIHDRTVLRGLQNELDKKKESDKLIADSERIRLGGLEAIRKAEAGGVTNAESLAEARRIGEDIVKLDLQKEAAAKGAAAARKAEAEARRREREEAERQSKINSAELEARNQIRQLGADIDKKDSEDLAARLTAVDAKYAKIFDTLQKLRDLKVNSLDGQSLDDVQELVNKSVILVKNQETQKFYAEQINDLEKSRTANLQQIRDQVESGAKTAQQGYDAAREVTSDIDEKTAKAAINAIIFAKALGGANPSPELQAFIDKMQAVLAPTNRQNSPVSKLGSSLFSEQKRQLDELIAQRDHLVDNEKHLASEGLKSQVDAQAGIRDAYDQTTPKILAQIDALEKFATDLHDTKAISDITFSTMISDLGVVRQQTVLVDENFKTLKQGLENSFVQGIGQAFDTVAEAFGKAVAGTGSWKEAIQSLGVAAVQFAAQFLKNIADILIQMEALQLVKKLPFFDKLSSGILDFTGLATGAAALAVPASALNTAGLSLNIAGGNLDGAGVALGTAGVGLDTSAGTLAGASTVWFAVIAGLNEAAAALAAAAAAQAAASAFAILHDGGVIGESGGAVRSRSVSPSIFANAPRYHSGTVVGLRPDEQAAILQNGEEVLDKGNPRNILNGGAAAPGKAGRGGLGGLKLRVVALFDQSHVHEAMAAPPGEQTILAVVRKHAGTIAQFLPRK
jgi:hypothetical protein